MLGVFIFNLWFNLKQFVLLHKPTILLLTSCTFVFSSTCKTLKAATGPSSTARGWVAARRRAHPARFSLETPFSLALTSLKTHAKVRVQCSEVCFFNHSKPKPVFSSCTTPVACPFFLWNIQNVLSFFKTTSVETLLKNKNIIGRSWKS